MLEIKIEELTNAIKELTNKLDNPPCSTQQEQEKVKLVTEPPKERQPFADDHLIEWDKLDAEGCPFDPRIMAGGYVTDKDDNYKKKKSKDYTKEQYEIDRELLIEEAKQRITAETVSTPQIPAPTAETVPTPQIPAPTTVESSIPVPPPNAPSVFNKPEKLPQINTETIDGEALRQLMTLFATRYGKQGQEAAMSWRDQIGVSLQPWNHIEHQAHRTWLAQMAYCYEANN